MEFEKLAIRLLGGGGYADGQALLGDITFVAST